MKNTIYAVMALLMLMTSCNEEYPLEGIEYPTFDEKMVLQGFIYTDGGVEATVSHTIPFGQMKRRFRFFTDDEMQSDPKEPDASIADARLYLCEDGKEVIEVPYVDGTNYRLEAGSWNMAPDKKYSLKVVSHSFGTASSEPYYMPSVTDLKEVEVYRHYYWRVECDVSFENNEPNQNYNIKITRYNAGMEMTRSVSRNLRSNEELGEDNFGHFFLDDCDSVRVDLCHYDNRYGLFMDALDQYADAFSDGYAGKVAAPEGNVDAAFGIVINASRVTMSMKVPQKDLPMDYEDY